MTKQKFLNLFFLAQIWLSKINYAKIPGLLVADTKL
jgi:hypothetical protein